MAWGRAGALPVAWINVGADSVVPTVAWGHAGASSAAWIDVRHTRTRTQHT